VRGLMTVGPEGDPPGARRAFDAVADLGRRLGTDELSMGMSDDFEEAVRAGATTVRLGRVLFGARPGAAVGGR
jgi:PLP dependent protein